MTRTLLIPGLASALALAACAPAGPPLQNVGTTNTQQGAIIGGIAGAVTGAIADDDERARGAVLGGILGAAGGGAIGAVLDRQEARLRQQVGDQRIAITNTGEALVVTLPQDILFATDSAAVRPDLQDDLRAVAANLGEFPNSTVQVIGHADNTGTAAYNQQLSSRRAQSVAEVLTGAGVPGSRVVSLGRGEDQPIASNLTPEGRALNRRVEIVIRPNA